MVRVKSIYLCSLIVGVSVLSRAQNVTENEIRPYEFTFNIVDFQHRSEKRDDNGLITGEYGFITADGIYHETAYATDETGDFIITKQRHRKITSLKDAEEIFKDRPEQAKMLTDALMKSCAGCDDSELDRQESSSFVRQESRQETTTEPPKKSDVRLEKKLDLAMKEMMKILNRKSEDVQTGVEIYSKGKKLSSLPIRAGKELNPSVNGTTNEIIRDMVDAAKKVLLINDPENEREELTSDEALEKMANDLFYRFNYTITSHGHREDGFRDGRKDGEYNAKFKEGIDTNVKYISNEFGYQPNITLVPRKEESVEAKINNSSEDLTINYSNNDTNTTNNEINNNSTTEPPYQGHYFSWFRK